MHGCLSSLAQTRPLADARTTSRTTCISDSVTSRVGSGASSKLSEIPSPRIPGVAMELGSERGTIGAWKPTTPICSMLRERRSWIGLPRP